MTAKKHSLSAKAVTILEHIAEGRTYDQILALSPDFTYLDIFETAREALNLGDGNRADYAARMARIKQRYPRAYERWTQKEDSELARLARDEIPVAELATRFQRQPSAIRSRLARLESSDD